MTDTGTSPDDLPAILAGPILRRLSPERLRIWLVASRPLSLTLELSPSGESPRRQPLGEDDYRLVPMDELQPWKFGTGLAIKDFLQQRQSQS